MKLTITVGQLRRHLLVNASELDDDAPVVIDDGLGDLVYVDGLVTGDRPVELSAPRERGCLFILAATETQRHVTRAL